VHGLDVFVVNTFDTIRYVVGYDLVLSYCGPTYDTIYSSREHTIRYDLLLSYCGSDGTKSRDTYDTIYYSPTADTIRYDLLLSYCGQT